MKKPHFSQHFLDNPSLIAMHNRVLEIRRAAAERGALPEFEIDYLCVYVELLEEILMNYKTGMDDLAHEFRRLRF